MSEPMIITFACRIDAYHYVRGMRVAIDSPRWYVRIWRWIVKRNLRVASVDYERPGVTLEFCR